MNRRRFTDEYTDREVKYWTAIVYLTGLISGIAIGLFIG